MPLLLAQQLPVLTETLPALTAAPPPPGQVLTEAPPAEIVVPRGTTVKPALTWLPRLS